ncbi:probable cinnamyl alcohol dehydrogenase 1 [Prunus persica]|uniref:probable cinnamyl alcohol dehydrogenase 1 n=1 Tax=Prunus persica TaxID=3760 RepID=UPI0009AB6512|nr:probable cinnamyl alcohol dehydrogenase 1 [Prunus persica]
MLRGEKSAIPLLYLARVGDPTFHEDAGLIKKQAASNHTLIPANYPLASAAPLLCAGITVYASMVRHKMNQPATSISKKEEALSQLGADNFVVSSDRNQMKALVKSVDFIIDIASGDHPFDPYMELLKLVEFWSYGGIPQRSQNQSCQPSYRYIGGTKDIQEMIDFFASNGIHPMIEIIPIQSANEAIEGLLKSVVIYWFAIDIENSLK